MGEGWAVLGIVYLGLENYDRSVEALERAKQLNTKNIDLSLSLGLAYYFTGQFLKARSFLEEGVRSNPNLPEGYVALGGTYHHSGDLDRALEQYRKALTINSNVLPAVNNIGLIQYEKGNVAAAIQSWQKAQTIDRTSAEPKLALGVALYRQGERDQGLNLVREALRLEPKFQSPDYMRKNLWGERLLSDAQAPLQASTQLPSESTQLSPNAIKSQPLAQSNPSSSNLIPPQSTATSPSSVSPSNLTEQTYSIASETTILIQGQNPGSGVIISKAGNTYYVLTAKHVVATQDEYLIVTPDGKEYSVDYSKVRKLPKIDLAILEFSSKQNYKTAFLGNSDQVKLGSIIYVSGWPKPGKAITKPTHLVTDGKLSGFQREEPTGYELLYSNSTAPGMSGGPVLNSKGQVVGIHGLAEGNSVSGKVGINLGIPIKLFFEFAPQAGVNLRKLGLGGG